MNAKILLFTFVGNQTLILPLYECYCLLTGCLDQWSNVLLQHLSRKWNFIFRALPPNTAEGNSWHLNKIRAFLNTNVNKLVNCFPGCDETIIIYQGSELIFVTNVNHATQKYVWVYFKHFYFSIWHFWLEKKGFGKKDWDFWNQMVNLGKLIVVVLLANSQEFAF